jgi:uncharacterized protein (TIGR03435 family)
MTRISTRGPLSGWRRALTVVSAMVASIVHVYAGIIARAATSAQPGGSVPSFEVATIRIDRSGNRRAMYTVMPRDGRLTITNVTVRDLIQDAFGVPSPSQLVNAPDWTRSQRVDVVAKAASPASAAVLQRMLQPLLADSFNLTTHRENRDTDVFGLVLARPNRTGPQLRRSEDACDDRVGTAAFARADEGARNQRGTCGILPGGAGRIVARGLDMPGLAAYIGSSPGRMVIDQTGLEGRFDVDLTYTPSFATSEALAQRGGGAPPPGVDPSGPMLLTALEEQLGLKLRPTRAPVTFIVVDHVEPLRSDADR